MRLFGDWDMHCDICGKVKIHLEKMSIATVEEDKKGVKTFMICSECKKEMADLYRGSE